MGGTMKQGEEGGSYRNGDENTNVKEEKAVNEICWEHKKQVTKVG